MPVPATTGRLCTSIQEMNIGDYIICEYQASSGQVGVFRNLGTSTAPEIPVTGSATPNGSFYFVMVDKKTGYGGLLIADRVIQHSISWDTLNTRKYIQGVSVDEITLLHFDVDFSDDKGNVWTPTGACVIDTSRPKFGTGCLYTPSETYLSCTDSRFAFGTNDFTIDFWMYYGGNGYSGISTARIGGNNGIAIQPDAVWIGNNYSTIKVSDSGYFVANDWAHYALVRSGNTFYYFVNGILKGSTTFSGSISESTMVINSRYSNRNIGGNCYYDEISVTHYAKWVSNFTPPTSPYGADNLWYSFRSLTGGVAYADANGNKSTTDQGFGGWPTTNEWDKYVVNFPADKIQAGKTLDDVFHWNIDTATWTQDTPMISLSSSGLRVIRGKYKFNNNYYGGLNFLSYSSSNSSGITWGFRPVLEYKEV